MTTKRAAQGIAAYLFVIAALFGMVAQCREWIDYLSGFWFGICLFGIIFGCVGVLAAIVGIVHCFVDHGTNQNT